MGKAKIEQAFQAKLQANKKLFVPYIMAGDGGLDILEERITFLQEAGASAIELGIPFSDPSADGPTIQEAGIRSLKNGTTLTNILETLQAFKETPKIPIIFMTYMNPIYRYGIDAFCADCAKAGVDGIIIPDVPSEEEALIAPALAKNDIAFIRLAALTSSKERSAEIAKRTEGFLYAVAVTGTTGARTTHDEKVKAYLKDLKEVCPVPVLAGFGVSSSDQARDLGSYCDGVIVGSKIVQLLHEGNNAEVKSLIEESI